MAKFFNSAASMISNALSKSPDPNQVREVSSNTYSSWPVRRREDCLLLHGPQLTVPAGQGDEKVTKLESYEIIVQRDTNRQEQSATGWKTNEFRKIFIGIGRIGNTFYRQVILVRIGSGHAGPFCHL